MLVHTIPGDPEHSMVSFLIRLDPGGWLPPALTEVLATTGIVQAVMLIRMRAMVAAHTAVGAW